MKKVTYKSFRKDLDLKNFVSENTIEVVSITKGTFLTTLWYYEKPKASEKPSDCYLDSVRKCL